MKITLSKSQLQQLVKEAKWFRGYLWNDLLRQFVDAFKIGRNAEASKIMGDLMDLTDDEKALGMMSQVIQMLNETATNKDKALIVNIRSALKNLAEYIKEMKKSQEIPAQMEGQPSLSDAMKEELVMAKIKSIKVIKKA